MRISRSICSLALCAVLAGCGGTFTSIPARWPPSDDGIARVPFRLQKDEGDVQPADLIPARASPMSPASEAAWREALGKWEAASAGAIRLVEDPSIQLTGETKTQGIVIFDSPSGSLNARTRRARDPNAEYQTDVFEIPSGRGVAQKEGETILYPFMGPWLERASATATEFSVSDRYARYIRLHEVGHLLGLKHSTNPLDVMFPITIQGIVPSVEPSSGDVRALRRKYRPPR